MLDSLFLRDLIVYAVLVIFVLFVTKQNNMWGTKKGTSKTKVDVKKARDLTKKRNWILKILYNCDRVCHNFGFQPSLAKIEKYKFNINRCGITAPYTERYLTPTELIGLFKVVKFVGCFLAFFLSLLTGNKLFLLLISVLAIDVAFNMIVEAKIMEEDSEIEKDFPDLYMLLYSRLVRGTQVRLAPTLDEYIKSLEVIYGDKSHSAMKKFVLELRKNIEIYGDDSIAVHKMRETYKSAMLVNFFNLAIQSLRGVDNKDKLLAFRMELSQKKLDAMTVKANKMVEKGQKAVMLIFLILAQFIVLSWIAKAGLSFGML